MTTEHQSEPYPCDLCSLPVEVDRYQVATHSGLKRFCCEGCEGIFRMLHADQIPPQKSLT
jgi:Putative metal-binding domain of cation transport ATPase